MFDIQSRLNKYLIFLVEDNDVDVEIFIYILRQSRFSSIDMQRFCSVDAAINALEHYQGNKHYILILFDLNMPGRSGRDLLLYVRQSRRWHANPAIAFSTSLNPQDVAWCYANGANSYINKAIDLQQFMKIVDITLRFWLEIAIWPCNR
ncbi:MAG: response regulator [Holosporales bacterium]